MRSGILALTLALLPAPAAHAATVTLEYEPPIPEIEPEPAYTLAVEALPGEANRLGVGQDSTGFIVRDTSGAPLSPGAGCTESSPGVVRCALASGTPHVSVFVDAGNGDDAVVLGRLVGLDVAEVFGGPGDDTVVGNSEDDLLIAEAGADTVTGAGGNDRIDGGEGADTLDGGDGRDLITYASHGSPVTADLADGTGGSRGEHDVLTGFEDLAGGTASDRLFGDSRDNLLYGGLGGRRDAGWGRGGADTVTLRGRAVGGRGNDVLDAERVGCGAGSDVAFRQRFQPPGPYARACERIRWSFYIVTRPRIVHGALVVRFACTVRTCRGTVEVHDRRGLLGKERYAADSPPDRDSKAVRIRVELERRPVGRIGKFVVTGQAGRRDSFRIAL